MKRPLCLAALMATPFLLVPAALGPAVASASLAQSPLVRAQAQHVVVSRPAGVTAGSAQTEVQSTNWSGYADTGDTFRSGSGSWVQPSVSCSARQTAYSAFWVGLDGYSSDSVEQIGTDSDCNRGRPSYYGWYEMYPAGEVQLPASDRVSGGDTLTASVSSNGAGTSFTLALADASSSHAGWQYAATLSSSSAPARSSVEWVAEAPSECSFFGCSVLPLADFGSVAFSGATTTDTAGHQGVISSFADDAIEMATSRGTPKAVPTALVGAGNGFSVSWAHS